jgi:hypothetical protein
VPLLEKPYPNNDPKKQFCKYTPWSQPFLSLPANIRLGRK